MIIKSRGFILRYVADKAPVQVGDTHGAQTITGGSAPRSDHSTGKVWTEDAQGNSREFLPHLLGMEWIPDPESESTENTDESQSKGPPARSARAPERYAG